MDQGHAACKWQSEASPTICTVVFVLEPANETQKWGSWSCGEREQWKLGEPASLPKCGNDRVQDNHQGGGNSSQREEALGAESLGSGGEPKEKKQRNDWGRTRARSTQRGPRGKLSMMKRANNIYDTDVQKQVSDLSSMRSFIYYLQECWKGDVRMDEGRLEIMNELLKHISLFYCK